VSRRTPFSHLQAGAARLRRLLLGLTRHGLGAGLAFMAGLAVLQVVLRYLFAASITWVEEVSVLALLWIAWMGAVHLWLARGHIGVDLLVPTVGKGRDRLNRLLDLSAIAGGLLLVWAAQATVAAFGGVVMGSLEIPGAIKYYPVVFGGAGLALAGLVNLLADSAARPDGGAPEHRDAARP